MMAQIQTFITPPVIPGCRFLWPRNKAVTEHLRLLRQKGVITREPGKARGVSQKG
jgi:hypothetical protein